MPDVINDGVRIHYEREGSGPPLVLQHGFTRSLEGWRDSGYVDALKDDYELILIDARGHGKSDKPHDPADYALDKRAADITAVLDDAGIDRAIYWGYSMGGQIGYALAQYAPERFDALILGGMHPYARDPAAPGWRDRWLRRGVGAARGAAAGADPHANICQRPGGARGGNHRRQRCARF